MATKKSPAPQSPDGYKLPTKRGLPKWVLWLGGAGVLLGLLALIAPFFIPWDKLKDQATAYVSQSLGRELSIGAVDVSLFTGVHVKDIRLANAKGDGFSAQPLFSVADAKINVSFLSLLTGKVVLNKITFVKPQVLIETDPEGTSNLKGLSSAAASAPAEKPVAAKEPAKPLPVVVAALIIQDGDIVIRDKAKKTETAVHGLQLKLMGLSLAAAGGSRLELALDAEVEGKKIPLSIVSNFKLDVAGDSVTINSLEAKAPAVLVNAKGTVQHFSAKPAVDVDLSVDLALADLPKLLPPSALKKIPGELKSAGKVRLSVQAKGDAADLKAMDLKAQLGFDKVDLAYGSYPGLAGLQGTLSVDKAGADLPSLDFKLGGDPVRIKLSAKWGSLDNLLGGAANLKADVDFALSSPKLNLDPVVAIAMVDDTPAELAAKAEAQQDAHVPDMRPSVPAGLNLKVSMDVDQLTAKTFKTGKLKALVTLKARKLASALDLDLYNGKLWERINADFNTLGPLWGGQVGVSKLDLKPLVDDLAASMPQAEKVQGLKGKVEGALTLQTDLKGKGFTRGTRIRNLQANGTFQLKDGVIRKTDIQERLASVIPHAETQAVLRSDIRFATARGDFAYGADRVTLKNFALGTGDDWRGGDLFLQAVGFMDLGKTVDFKVVPHFNPTKVSVGGEVGNAFKDSAGWFTYDYIAYYGPSMKEAKADFTAGLKKAAGKAVQQQVDKVKQAAQQKVNDAVKDKAGDVIKKLPGGLQHLFGQ